MPTDTQNSLVDFDLALALAQQAINTQMKYAWKAWQKGNNFKDKISIFKTTKNKTIVPSQAGIEAYVKPLTIDLNVTNAKLAQVKVTLTLYNGVVKYFDEGELSEFEFTGDWRISFIADLDKKPVDLEILKQIDPDTHRTAEAVIKKSGLPEFVFAIEYLFMKFTQVDLMLSDNKNIEIPDDVPRDARDKALSSLNYLLQGELSNFILGTVVRRNESSSTPTFALTDFIFNVHPDPKYPKASSLAYLGMLAKNPMPKELTIARTKLQYPWLRRELIDGTEQSVSGVMAISKNVFMGKYILPKFTAMIGSQPTVSGLKWTYSGKWEKKFSENDIIARDYDFGVSWELSLTVNGGTNEISMSGRIHSHALMDGYTHGARWHSEWIHMEGHKDFSGTVKLTGNNIGSDFNLASALTYKFENVVVDNNSVEGGAKVLEAFGTVAKALTFIGETPSEQLGNSMQKNVTSYTTWIEAVLRQVEVNLTNHAFIPPGGGVFTFSNPRFTEAGDLMWNVIYIAP